MVKNKLQESWNHWNKVYIKELNWWNKPYHYHMFIRHCTKLLNQINWFGNHYEDDHDQSSFSIFISFLFYICWCSFVGPCRILLHILSILYMRAQRQLITLWNRKTCPYDTIFSMYSFMIHVIELILVTTNNVTLISITQYEY